MFRKFDRNPRLEMAHTMTQQYDFDTLKEAILFNTVEVLPGDPKQLDTEIRTLVEQANLSGQSIRHYIGFEISGQVHIGTGMMTAIKIAKLQQAGVVCTIWLADYHTWLNNKLDGNIQTARRVATSYFGPVMAKCIEIAGGDISKLEVQLAKDVYFGKRIGELSFWDFDLEIGKHLTLSRVLKSVSIMGKTAGDNVDFGTLRYPSMQVADAFILESHLVHAGMDQRKCHVLMREAALSVRPEFGLRIGEKQIKPIAIHHKLLLSLGITSKDVTARMTADKKADNILPDESEAQAKDSFEDIKMSKSKPDSAIWVHDSVDEIVRKLRQAYCPIPQSDQTPEQIETEQNLNPILNWCENLIYPAGQVLELNRPEKFGGNKVYNSFESLKNDYFQGLIHPLDLKDAVARCLATWFAPIREWIAANPEGLEVIKSIKK